MKFIFHILLFSCVLIPSSLLGESMEEKGGRVTGPSESLSLQKVFQMVLDVNPSLKALNYELEALAGRKLQAGRRPNPEFSTVLENFAGTGGIGFTNSAETTVSLTQRFELGGKRMWRERAVESEKNVASRDLESRRAELVAAAAESFVQILAAQERLRNRQELLDLAVKTGSIVVERVAAGKVSPIEQSRSAVTLETARLEREKAEKELIALKERLAGLWGGHGNDFEKVSGSFQLSKAMRQISTSPPVANSPEVKRAAAIIESQRSLFELQKSSRKPDISLGGGWRHLNQYGDSAWVATISIPLPLFDRKQGGIAEAQSRISRSVQEQKAIENMVLASMAETRQAAESANKEAETLSASILPSAQSAFSSLEEGYRQGKFDYLQVLDAQRTYFELKGRQIDAVLRTYTSIIRIHLLTGAIQETGDMLSMFDEKESSHEK